jgi:DHA1 family bicyclomycin/chloramphenicol resistance-like MFS transporter
MTAMTPLATDINLPALPAMAHDLRASEATAQLTLSLFLFGFALGQVFYGPLSDRIGRRPAALMGFALFAAGSVACVLAPTMETLLVARVAQALGGAGPVVVARAMARDFYDGPEAGRELSRMAAIMGFTPMVAPMIGAGLLSVAGWRANFAFVALVAVVFGVYLTRRLPESLARRRVEPLSFSSFFGGYGELARSPGFRVYMALNALSFAGLFAFISVGSFILQGVYGFSEAGFALVFGAGSLCYVCGSFFAARVMRRYGLSASIGVGVTMLAAGGCVMLLVALANADPIAVMAPMLVYWAGVGFVLPASMASAMAPFPHRAGAASSFLGLAQTLFAAAVGAVLGQALSGSALPLPLCTALSGVAALALFALSRATRAAHARR